MKTIGEQARDFRLAKKWTTTKMAREVRTSRQNIEHLESRGGITPHYISDLARVMEKTVDALLNGGNDGSTLASTARATPSELSDWALDLAQQLDGLKTPEARRRGYMECTRLLEQLKESEQIATVQKQTSQKSA